MKKTWPRIIFFILASIPTPEEEAEAYEYGLNVVFRNANLITSSKAIEHCDGVAGAVPESYKHKPHAEEAVSAFMQRHRDRIDALRNGQGTASAKAGKGKGKAEPEKATEGEISQPSGDEKAAADPKAPATPPVWTPNS